MYNIGIIVLFNRVYAGISSMYTNYTNSYDTSHVAYPKIITVEEQQAEWAIFAALQPPQADPSHIPSTTRRASTPATLHTYHVKYIPPYIFSTSAPCTSASPVLPNPPSASTSPTPTSPHLPSPKILSPTPTVQHQQGEDITHNLVQQML